MATGEKRDRDEILEALPTQSMGCSDLGLGWELVWTLGRPYLTKVTELADGSVAGIRIFPVFKVKHPLYGAVVRLTILRRPRCTPKVQTFCRYVMCIKHMLSHSRKGSDQLQLLD